MTSAGTPDPAVEVPDASSVSGLWVRHGRILDGGQLVEPADVWWIQAGPWFVDVRCPRPGSDIPADAALSLDAQQAFSGTITTGVVDGAPAITWWHDLDTMPRSADHHDVGFVERRGDVLVERGPGYEERWVLTAPARDIDIDIVELLAPPVHGDEPTVTARAIRVGSFAVIVWGAAGGTPGGSAWAWASGWSERFGFGRADRTAELGGVFASEGPSLLAADGWLRRELDPRSK